MSFLKKRRGTERQVEKEREKSVKKVGYGHYLGLTIVEHNHENAHSTREIMNAPGARRVPACK